LSAVRVVAAATAAGDCDRADKDTATTRTPDIRMRSDDVRDLLPEP